MGGNSSPEYVNTEGPKSSTHTNFSETLILAYYLSWKLAECSFSGGGQKP